MFSGLNAGVLPMFKRANIHFFFVFMALNAKIASNVWILWAIDFGI